MRRLLTLLSVLSFAGGMTALGVIACGGEPKTPLMPDSIDQAPLDGPEGGPPSSPSGAGTAPPAAK